MKRKNNRSRKAGYDSDTLKGTGLLVDGGNGFFYVIAHVPVKIGIANDLDVNPKLVGKLVQFSLDEGVVDDEGHVTGVVGNWVGPATDAQKGDVAPYVDSEVIAPPPAPPMSDMDVPGPMDLGIGGPSDMGADLGMGGPDIVGPMDMDLGMEPPMGDMGPPMDDMGPPMGLEEGLPPMPMDVPIEASRKKSKRSASKQKFKLWEAGQSVPMKT